MVAFRTHYFLRLFLAALLILAGAITSTLAAAQTERPRIGLVLSGGGARGVAHIGVLKVLEEMRVPVDCIAGTSMGALVGGVYASGEPLDKITESIGKVNWDEIFTDEPPRSERPFNVKRDDFTPLFRFQLGLRDWKLLLPPGTTSGYKFEFLLRVLTNRAGNFPDQDFDRLPIPYRAVATNLENGEMTVFRRGDLAKALRASMSVPGLISPMDIDGVLHVDGGLVRNLPVDIAREACADVVIAVNLGSPLLPRSELNSVLGVALQSINLLTEQNVRRSLGQLRAGDILIEPKLGSFSAGNFQGALKTIPIGEAAARAEREALARLSVSEDDYRAWREAALAKLVPAPKVTGTRVTTGDGWVNPKVIEDELEEVPGIGLRVRAETDFSLEHLNDRLVQIYGRGDFESMGYSMVDGEGRRTVLIEGIEKSWGPDYVRFGLGLATDTEQTRFNALVSHRKTWINSLGAEWRNDLQLGYTKFFRSEFYQPLGLRSGAFVAPRIELQREPIVFFLNERKIGDYEVSYARAYLDVGLQNKFGEARIGSFTGTLKAKEDFGLTTGVPDFDIQQVGYTARFVFDQIDNPNFPRDGVLAVLRTFGTVKDWGSDDQYNKTDLLLMAAKSFGPHAIQLAGGFGYTFEGEPPPYDPFQLGGFLRGSGYLIDQLSGENVEFARAVYSYRLARLPTALGRGVYAGGSLEGVRVRGPLDPFNNSKVRPAASIFLGAETFLGTAYIAYGHAFGDQSASAFYFLLGNP
ncbi:MAG: patatin-like phospholipase family protein [Betaproteobacteria bacterium]|nr:patatin-like phospholipase family protein [Betaproteobacteria bacterium]MDH3437043.1 patatin-like phospholipase family protein [Betaproteobacteria bacterium]